MKKLILTAAVAVAALSMKAQEVVNVTAVPSTYTPQKGDWSIGVDVVPIIKTVGNLFHSPSGNDSIYSERRLHLVGQYVKNETTAYQATLRIGFGSTRFNNLVQDDNNITAKLTDTWTSGYFDATLGFGIKKWKGVGRLRGTYGAGVALMLGSSGQTFTYGNAFTSTNQTPTSTDFSSRDSLGAFTTGRVATRVMDVSDGFRLGFALNGALGVEYFFAPKMSLSAEYGWGLVYGSVGEASVQGETWTGGSGGNVTLVDSKIAKSSAYNVDVRDAGQIVLHFYF